MTRPPPEFLLEFGCIDTFAAFDADPEADPDPDASLFPLEPLEIEHEA